MVIGHSINAAQLTRKPQPDFSPKGSNRGIYNPTFVMVILRITEALGHENAQA
jgi:hypothetical protein